MQTEPARWSSLITAVVVAVIALAVAFGAPITDSQREAIIAVIPPAVVVIFALGEFIRSKVYAPSTVERVQAQAYTAGKIGNPKPELAAPPAK